MNQELQTKLNKVIDAFEKNEFSHKCEINLFGGKIIRKFLINGQTKDFIIGFTEYQRYGFDLENILPYKGTSILKKEIENIEIPYLEMKRASKSKK
jgi:hypothetical protein